MSGTIKICGITTNDAIDAAARAGATHAGFIFFAGSPRAISPAEAGAIAARAPGVRAVAVTVDADDAMLYAISAGLHPQMWQLHGDEPPERVAAIRQMFRVPVMKAIPISGKEDVKRAHRYETVADWLLFDAKPEKLPGGGGLAFDWQLLAGETWTKPWMLSGGLNATNVAEAIRTTRACAVDVSSGVERTRGTKDPSLIERFIAAARAAFAESVS